MEEIYYDITRKIKNKEVAFFIAAGASLDPPSNLPISKTLFQKFSSLVFKEDSNPISLISELSLKLRFEVFFQIFTDFFLEKSVELLKVLDKGEPNFNHKFIAKLASQKLIPLVLTTNFDILLEKALDEYKSTISDYELVFRDHDYEEIDFKNNKFKILKLHGSLRDKTGNESCNSILISVNQVGKTANKKKQSALKYIFKNYHLIFIGYSGMDDFDLLPLLLTTKSDKFIYWVNHNSDPELKYISADNIRAKKNDFLKYNYGKILHRRRKGYLIEGLTYSFINELSKNIFGECVARPNGTNVLPPDFNYLRKWKKSVPLEENKNYLRGLILNQAGMYRKAIKCFQKVNATSPHFLLSSIQESLSLKFCSQTSKARNILLKVIENRAASKQIIAKGLMQLGLLEAENTNFKLSRKYLIRALKINYLNLNDLSRVRNNIAISYLIEADLLNKKGDSKYKITYKLFKALDNFKEALRLANKDVEPYHYANIEDNLGLTYVQLRKFQLAKRKHFNALNIYKSLYQFREEASCLDNIGLFYKEQRDYLNALKNFRNAFNLKKIYSTNRRIALTMYNIAEVYYAVGKYKFAQKWAEKAEVIFRKEGLKIHLELIQSLIVNIDYNLHSKASMKK